MAKSIAVTDTHRLCYPNGTLTAKKYGTTTNIKFYDGAGNELGETVRLNAKGYFCASNGTIYANGVFVKEDATITLTFPDGATTSWTVKGEIAEQVNDGKLLDLNGNQVWSANSGNNYTLNYEDLANKPRINEWAECDQLVTITSDTYADNIVTVDKHTKAMTFASHVAPAEAPALRVKLVPEVATRWAQNIIVKNLTGHTLWLFNPDDSIACLVRPGQYKLMCYDTTMAFHQSGDWEIKQFYGGPTSETLNTIMDACRKWFINANVPAYFTELYANFKLSNAEATDFYLSWMPPAATQNSTLTVNFISASSGQVVRVLKLRPYQTVHCIAYAANAGLTVIGETEFGPKYQYVEVENSSSGNGVYHLPEVADDVDVLVVNAKDMVPGASAQNPVPCDVYVNVRATRVKPLRVLVTNVCFTYVFYRLGVSKGGVAQNLNYRSAIPMKMVQSKERNPADQEVKIFLEYRLDFCDTNNMGTGVLACAAWSGQVGQ